MNLNNLHQKLIAAARTDVPSDRVPYAFEKRIMAHLTSRPLPDGLALWGQALWRAAFSCAAIGIVAGALSFFTPEANVAANTGGIAANTSSTELSQDFENTLLAAVDQSEEAH
jgi:hypothetical protein